MPIGLLNHLQTRIRRLLFLGCCLGAAAVSADGTSLAEIRQMGTGQTVTVSRAVIASDFDMIASSTSKSFQLQDETGGITVFGSAAVIDALLAGRSAGDELLGLSGQTGQFRGLFQLQGPFSLADSKVGPGPPTPWPLTVEDLQNGNPEAESLESRLVTLRNVTFAASGLFEGPRDYLVSDAGQVANVRVQTNALPIVGGTIPTGLVDVTGVLSQFTSSNPADDGYQLLIRTPDDIRATGGFNQWQAEIFRGPDLRNDAVGGPEGDADGDGVPNLFEYAFGGNPKVPNTATMPEFLIGAGFQTSHLRLRFLRTAALATEIRYRVEASSDLVGWSGIWSSEFAPYPSGAGESFWQNASDPVAVEQSSGRFLRLVLERVETDFSVPDPDPGSSLTVVSWNIQWFPGRSPTATEAEQEAHIAGVGDYLATLDADILLLQEIGGRANLEAALSSLDGYEVHVVSNFFVGSQPSRQQLAIVSKLSADTAFAQRFAVAEDPDGARPPRGFAFAALELPGGEILLCYSLHLKSNVSGTAEENKAVREESARQVMAHQAEMEVLYAGRPGIRTVVGGDFNTLLTQAEYTEEQTLEIIKDEGFHWTWEGVPFSQRITWPGRGSFGDANFDHILTRGLGTPVARVLGQPSPNVSDHNPVEVTVGN